MPWIVAISVILNLFLISQVTDLNEKQEVCESEVSNLSYNVAALEEDRDLLTENLDQANQNIEDINSFVEDAKMSIGVTYEDMENALDSIEEGEIVY